MTGLLVSKNKNLINFYAEIFTQQAEKGGEA